MAKPTVQQQQAAREQHVQPTQEQLSHETSAQSDRNQFASANHGRPAKLAMGAIDNSKNPAGINRTSNPQGYNAQNTDAGHRKYSGQAMKNDNQNLINESSGKSASNPGKTCGR